MRFASYKILPLSIAFRVACHPSFAPRYYHHGRKLWHAQRFVHPFNQHLNAFLDVPFMVSEGKLATASLTRLRTHFAAASAFISLNGFVGRNTHRYRVGLTACTTDEDPFFVALGKVAADIFLLFGTGNVKEVGTVAF
jgi:hypothetical protein